MSGMKIATFRERLTDLISSSGKSQSSIADEFGVAKQTISAWITGQSSPRAPVLSALADYFGVSLAWLMGYDVPRIDPKESLSLSEDAVPFQDSLSPDESLLLDGYRALSDSGKQYMLTQLTAAKAIYGEKDTSASVSNIG